MIKEKTYKILAIILIMQWAFIQLLAQFPDFIEKYYSTGLYVFISRFLRIILGWIPISIGDIFYLFLFYYILKRIFVTIKSKKIAIKRAFFKLGGIVSVIFFLFYFNWGLNYFRQPLIKTLNYEKSSYTNDELFSLTKKLIEKLNKTHELLVENDTLIVNEIMTKKEIRNSSILAYNELQKNHSMFAYKNPSIKTSLLSLPLTYMGFAGYLNPITNESQSNSLIPNSGYPITVCHEISHQLGIASEKEANFVAYLATTNSKDIYFNYSGYLMAVRYCLYDLYERDNDKYEVLNSMVNKGILKDIEKSRDFWNSYQNWSEQFFKLFYDSYLKANKQEEGIKDYNKVVLLLINYHLKD